MPLFHPMSHPLFLPVSGALLALLAGGVGGFLLGRGRGRRKPGEGLGAPMDSSALGLFITRSGVIAWASVRGAELLGIDAEHLVGASLRSFHLDEAAFLRFGEQTAALFEQGQAFRGDVRLRKVDGSPFWAYLVGNPMVMGRPAEGVLWFVEDASERVEAQLDLAEVLSLNQTLIAATPNGVLLYRAADGACVLANEAAARICSASPEALLKQNFRRLQSWKESGLRQMADKVLNTGVGQQVECHFVSTFGAEVWIVAHFVPFTSRGERLLLLLAEDVSENRKASVALRTSEEKHRVVVEALYEGMALVDLSGRFAFCNSRLCEMGGYAPGELLGMHYSQFVPEVDLPALLRRQILARAVASETFEMSLLRRDGSPLDCRISAASVLDGQGAPTGLAILVTDISIQRKADSERERLVAELEQKNKELETLLYVASHDLRSPLVNIQGFSQRLAKSLGEIRRAEEAAGSLEGLRAAMAPHLQERMPASLEFIRASGTKMDAIINGLLTLSRAGRMVLRTEALDMNALVHSCAAALAYQLQSVEGTLQVEELPPCKGDPLQVAQILSNLLDNAVKYRDPQRPLRVRVSGGPADGFSAYCIEDNGLGIAPEHQDRVWEIFQRLDPQGPIQGEGLGLTLVRRMAERNGGRVRMESAPGTGCRFILELPVEAQPS